MFPVGRADWDTVTLAEDLWLCGCGEVVVIRRAVGLATAKEGHLVRRRITIGRDSSSFSYMYIYVYKGKISFVPIYFGFKPWISTGSKSFLAFFKKWLLLDFFSFFNTCPELSHFLFNFKGESLKIWPLLTSTLKFRSRLNLSMYVCMYEYVCIHCVKWQWLYHRSKWSAAGRFFCCRRPPG